MTNHHIDNGSYSRLVFGNYTHNTTISSFTRGTLMKSNNFQREDWLIIVLLKYNKLIHFLSFSVSVMSIPIDNNSIPANLAKLSSIAISYSRIDLFISE